MFCCSVQDGVTAIMCVTSVGRACAAPAKCSCSSEWETGDRRAHGGTCTLYLYLLATCAWIPVLFNVCVCVCMCVCVCVCLCVEARDQAHQAVGGWQDRQASCAHPARFHSSWFRQLPHWRTHCRRQERDAACTRKHSAYMVEPAQVLSEGPL